MDWNSIWQIVLTAIASVGGISGVIIIAVKFSANLIAEQLSKKYELKLSKEMELYKASIENKTYITKTKFDTEFSIYRSLSKKFFQMVKDVYIMIPDGYTQVSADKDIRKKHDEEHYSTAISSIVAAQDELNENAPFILEEFFDGYSELLKISNMQTNAFSQRWNKLYFAAQEEKERLDFKDYKRTEELKTKHEELNKKIRKYLSELDVIE